MTDKTSIALLPQGLRDSLPPEAGHEAEIVLRMLAVFDSCGYERVRPPLVEFEESLLGDAGSAMARDTFRLMDPVSHRMMGVRADMTLQVARIAVTRLKAVPRPLRLSYAGEVLRTRGIEPTGERQLWQVGAELIGAGSAAADAECVVLAAESLGAVGVPRLTVDLSSPRLAPAVCAGLGIEGEAAVALRAALDRKDSARVAAIAGDRAGPCLALMDAAGPAGEALAALGRLGLPGAAKAELERLERVVTLVRDAVPALGLTVDPVEYRGLEYHTGVSFSIFATDARGELGRG
ncbi:MAG: ATP phosphoribosyltransferase regulatory subunit, partial [Alphaproteobacteria bacterium]